jgi:drug/metabolite transporter (DMT)-like permease
MDHGRKELIMHHETYERGLASALLAALLAAALFGAASPLGKLLLAEIEPFTLSGLLYLGAGLGMLPLALKDRKKTRMTDPAHAPVGRARRLRHLSLVLAMIAFGGVLGPVFLYFGLDAAKAADVSLWLNLEAAFTAALGALFFREAMGVRGWLGVAAGIGAGLALSALDGGSWVAASLVALACLCWAVDNHVTALIDGITPAASTAIKGLVAGSANVAFGLATSGKPPALGSVALALLLGFFAYGASVALYISSAQKLGATRAQLAFSASPLFGVALSALLLGDPLGLRHLLALALLGAGLALLMSERHAHAHAHPELVHVHSHRHDDGHHDHGHADGSASEGRHTHEHRHMATVHSHRHVSDLHHRHDHEGEPADDAGGA